MFISDSLTSYTCTFTDSLRLITANCIFKNICLNIVIMGTQQILHSHVMLPYTEEYQENVKYKHTLHGFNSIINLTLNPKPFL